MAERTRTIWTCDRCTERSEDQSQPLGWGRVSIASPPKGVGAVAGDLCNTCLADIRRFLATKVSKRPT